MIEKTVEIKNRAGIHCRPSSVIMAELEKYPDSQFKLISENGTSNMFSILELLSLGLQQGDKATLQVRGGREAEACEHIASLFEKEFDFPSKT